MTVKTVENFHSLGALKSHGSVAMMIKQLRPFTTTTEKYARIPSKKLLFSVRLRKGSGSGHSSLMSRDFFLRHLKKPIKRTSAAFAKRIGETQLLNNYKRSRQKMQSRKQRPTLKKTIYNKANSALCKRGPTSSSLLQKMYKCITCFKTFTSKTHLLMHRKTHLDDKKLCEVPEKPPPIISSKVSNNRQNPSYTDSNEKSKTDPCVSSSITTMPSKSIVVARSVKQGPSTNGQDVGYSNNDREFNLRASNDFHTEAKLCLKPRATSILPIKDDADGKPVSREKFGEFFKRSYGLRNKVSGQKSERNLHSGISQKPKSGLLHLNPTRPKQFSFNNSGSSILTAVSTSNGPFRCDKCEKTLKTETMLKNHTKIHGNKRPFICEQCGKAFAVLNALKSHGRTHSDERPFVCDRCGKAFKQNCHLRIHYMIHTGEKPYSCDECGMEFRQLSNLNFHRQSHTGARLLVRGKSGMAFDTLLNLKPLMKSHTKDTDNTVVQSSTQNNTKNFFGSDQTVKESPTLKKSALKTKKSFSCDKCDKVFPSLHSLVFHRKAHSGVEKKEFACKESGKTFGKPNSLKRHRMTHSSGSHGVTPNVQLNTGNHLVRKPASISAQQKLFSIDESVSEILEFPYKCRICQRSFNHVTHLEKHLKFHEK